MAPIFTILAPIFTILAPIFTIRCSALGFKAPGGEFSTQHLWRAGRLRVPSIIKIFAMLWRRKKSKIIAKLVRSGWFRLGFAFDRDRFVSASISIAIVSPRLRFRSGLLRLGFGFDQDRYGIAFTALRFRSGSILDRVDSASVSIETVSAWLRFQS